MKFINSSVFTIILVWVTTFPFAENVYAGPGMHGSKTVNSSNVILNEFTALTANAGAGAYNINVASSALNANGRFSTNMVAGELVMIIQVQGATLNTANVNSINWGSVSNYNNSGKYEFNEVASIVNGTTISLVYPLANSYTASGRVQVIRVPRYTSFHVNGAGSVTTQAWNGSTGGVLTVESNGATIIQGTIDVTGKGFRGGIIDSTSNSNHTIYASTLKGDGAEKGEGIGGDKTFYDLSGGRYGRGAPANGGGGGNSHNAGGGGGANGGNINNWNGLGIPDTITNVNWKTAWDLESPGFHFNISTGGGRGGYTYSMKNKNPLITAPGNTTWNGDDRFNVGGLGGRPLDNTGNRIFLGGGGGAGDNNNYTATNGANGGGVVYLLAGGAVTGNGTINANGADGLNSTGNDSPGGGGGGGTVIIYTNNAPVNNITVNAKGGKGGNQQRIQNTSGEAEGPGGGGGGGVILISNAGSLTSSTAGGANGTTNSPTMINFLPNGATMGANGSVGFPLNPYSGDIPLPVTLLNFSGKKTGNKIKLTWTTATEINNDFFTVEKSTDGEIYTVIQIVDGSGNSVSLNSYTHTDIEPISGNNYYRLSQTDFDGHSTTFDPVCIRFDEKAATLTINSIYPNPFNTQIQLSFSSPVKGTVQFRISDLNGKIIRTTKVECLEGINVFEFSNLSDMPKGIYFVSLIQDSTPAQVVKICKN